MPSVVGQRTMDKGNCAIGLQVVASSFERCFGQFIALLSGGATALPEPPRKSASGARQRRSLGGPG
eukprot:12093640-Alexandrium_andersonii.AAC.1